MIKHTFILPPLLAIGTLLEAAGPEPNIVLILSDDQGWTDYGFLGHDSIRTPHLDKLADRSLVFERGYVASPLCRPSLASIVTGRFPSEHGITELSADHPEIVEKLRGKIEAWNPAGK